MKTSVILGMVLLFVFLIANLAIPSETKASTDTSSISLESSAENTTDRKDTERSKRSAASAEQDSNSTRPFQHIGTHDEP